MMWPNWTLACTAGLGFALLPGCISNRAAVAPRSATQAKHLSESTADLSNTVLPPSPYHPTPLDPVNASAQGAESSVVPTGWADKPMRSQTPSAPSDPEPGTGKSGPVPAAFTSAVKSTAPPCPELKPAPASTDANTKVPEEPLLRALRCYLNKHPEEAIAALGAYDKSNQELLLSLLPILVRFAQATPNQNSPQEVAAFLGLLDGLRASLAPRAALTIDKICFCRKIQRFGVYEAQPEDYAFEAGVDNAPGEMVQVYVELRNFASEAKGTGFETWLAGRVEIRDLEGRLQWHQDFPAQPDTSRRPRQDYFVNYYFLVPPRLPPGLYTLSLQVKDLTGINRELSGASLDRQQAPKHRVALRTLEFRVAAPGAIRGSSSLISPSASTNR